MPLSEKTRELEHQIRANVEQTVDTLRAELRERLESGYRSLVDTLSGLSPKLPERFLPEDAITSAVEAAVGNALAEAEREVGARAAAAPAAGGQLREAVTAIDAAKSQAEVLAALTREAVRFASRSAVFLVRGGQLSGWDGQGFDGAASLRGQGLEAPEGSVWQRLIGGGGATAVPAAEQATLASRFEVPVAREAVVVPMVLRDRVAAVVYADRLGDGTLDTAALQTLTYVAALAIETLPLRERSSTATLTLEPEGGLEEPEPAAAALQPPAATGIAGTGIATSEPVVEPEPEPVAEPPVTISEETELGGGLEEVEVTLEGEEEAEEPESVAGWQVEDVEPPRPRPVPVEPSEVEPAELEVAEAEPPLLEVEETSDFEEVAAPHSEEPPAFSEQPSAPAVEEAAAPVEEEPPAAAPSAPWGGGEPAAPREPQPALGGSPQVEPPSDVQGPGWAFSSAPQQARDEDDEARHAEARRLARLLISEIKLYNEEQVLEGRKNHNVVERLKEDIDRSRELYEERVDERVRQETDYFYQEMVRVLGAGDPKTLGI